MRRDEPIFGDSAYPIPTVLLEENRKAFSLFSVKKEKETSLFPTIQKFLINIYQKFVRE
ncbi:hypothetical protein LEP1GSC041_1960 [Leptospira noguchii str. 2006001870]|nr:hypothetical protein LEP1GSC041_1960 [Leptospira noguchii str. 2006001870]